MSGQPAQREQGHQIVRRAQRTEHRPVGGERQHRRPVRRGFGQPIRPPSLNLCRSVDRQSPEPSCPQIALQAGAESAAREPIAIRNIAERRQTPLARDLPDMRMVDHDQIVARSKLGHRKGLEILQ
jgi:hypothetical protein